MASNNILVTFEDIQSMASRLQSEGGAIAAQLDSLLDAVAAMVESGWQGQAAGAFHGLYANATQGWKEVETALVGMAEMLRRIGAQYQDQESSIAASLNG
ncbi:MAG: WXG100 family type VII secretion target [Acidimicrobiales bacterium]|nr:WXG100 family type VII secretion target [Acidimicrobiales bacterium]